MGHQMFTYNEKTSEAIFAYCRKRLAMDPVPLDYGSLDPSALPDLAGLINPEVTLRRYLISLPNASPKL